MNPSQEQESKLTQLASELAKLSRREDAIKLELHEIVKQKHDIAIQINGELGFVPIKEAAEKIKATMARLKIMECRKKSEMIKAVWANKTQEERDAWKAKLKAGRESRLTQRKERAL